MTNTEEGKYSFQKSYQEQYKALKQASPNAFSFSVAGDRITKRNWP
jgi:hypothetical protein